MIRYEGDDRAVARVLGELNEGERIDASTARTIASWFNEPGIVESFVSTGAMPTDTETPGVDLLHAMQRGVDQATREANTDALLALDFYLEDREAAGDLGKVTGWSDMWVPKHVDYPHENGALDTCWCYEEPEHTCDCTPGVSLGCDADDCVIRDEPRVISPYGADTLGFSLD